jgi:simple sugar transport system ATP-binding protein
MTPGAAPTASSQPFLELRHIGKRFGGTVALRDIDWTVNPGEVHCLVGENGSGKSTLIKIIAGVHASDPGGEIAIDGVSHRDLTPHRAKSLGIQVIYQDLSLFPNLTVLENIAVDSELGGAMWLAPRRAMRAAAKAALARIEATLPLDARVATLPVAQRQLVAICRGLAVNARLLVMDEPTASLTRHEVDLLLRHVARLKALGVAVVFVSHRLGEVMEIAERVTVLRDGRKVGTFPASEVNDHRLAELMTGNRIEHRIVARQFEDRKPIIEVRGIARAGEFEDVSFTLHRGEVLGLTGLLGAGRTELALALFGMSRLDRGTVLVEGRPAKLWPNRAAIAAGVAYVSEDRLGLGVNLKQSIADNIAITVIDRLTKAGFVAPERRKALAADWVDRLNIRTPSTGAPVQTLSGGNQQRVVLAKWLAAKPKVLILDGPTVGVDIRNKQGIYEIIRGLARDGMAILLISDEIDEVYFNSDRVLHMRSGRIAGEYVPGASTEAALREAVYA